MDFMSGFPRASSGQDAEWVIADPLTKTVHFLPIKMTYSMDRLAKLYIKEIVRLHGIPVLVVSDHDPRFTSRFWRSLQEAMGDENQQASLKDPLHVPVGPITRVRSKMIKEALSGLIQEIWASSKTSHSNWAQRKMKE